MTSALETWRKALTTREALCFWTGPRPMRKGDRQEQLIGRERDVRAFADLVREVNLIVLSGESGAGKSSLLNAGIYPQLQDDGFLVLICSDWTADAGDAVPSGEASQGQEKTEEFLARKFADGLPKGIEAKAGFLRELDEQYGDGAVIILDQFEELMRHKPALYEEVRLWIQHAVDAHDVRIVISLREEFKHRLRELVVGPFKRADFYLHPLHARSLIKLVIRSGRRSDNSGDVISSEAVDLLLDLWERASGGKAWSGIGLLHLQALLYVLWRDACGSLLNEPKPDLSGVVVTLKQVEEALDQSRDSLGDLGHPNDTDPLPRAADSLFRAALARAVTYRLASARDVYLYFDPKGTSEDLKGTGAELAALRVQARPDHVLSDGVVTIIARMADHLASGGYKVDQEERHLAQLVLDEELATLGFAADLARNGLGARLFSQFAGRVREGGAWLTARRDDLVNEDDELLESIHGAKGGDGSSGPMMGFSRSAVLLEELRRYFFALEWLEASDLIRRTSPEDGTTMVTLVHDGFGRGLTEWADSYAEDARTATSRLTATVGKTLTWVRSARKDEPDPFDGSETELGRRYVNLRWRSSRVSEVSFRKVVFINCDFRWTSFDRCRFEGVTFVNCLLDGVEFSACTIVGGVTEAPTVPRGERPLPSFFIKGIELAAILDRYRETVLDPETADSERNLISWTAGLPAVPASSSLVTSLKEGSLEARGFRYQWWDPQTSGLMIYGGRLSSLMFAGCHGPLDAHGTQTAMGAVALRHVAGTSLDFGEQNAGSILLADVAIRGLTISPPVWMSEEELSTGDRESRGGVDDLFLEIRDSQVQNAWLSTPLRGRAEIKDSVIWQFFNSNGRDAFNVILDGNSPHAGVVNVAPGEFFRKNETFDVRNSALPEVDAAAKKVDYQSLRNLLRYLPSAPEDLPVASEEEPKQRHTDVDG